MDVPNGVPFDFRLAMSLSNGTFAAGSTDMDENIKPLDSQYALGPGDYAMSAATNALVDDNHTVMKILDPTAFSDRFPDWETRLQRSYILAEWISHRHKEPHIGWFSRVKLMPITEPQFQEASGWVDTQIFPSPPPSWVDDAYYKITEGLSQHDSSIPRAVECGKCGGHSVEIHRVSVYRWTNRAGVLMEDLESGEQKPRYTNLTDSETDKMVEAHLHCSECGARMDLTFGDMADLRIMQNAH
jgi:hypothetical protein